MSLWEWLDTDDAEWLDTTDAEFLDWEAGPGYIPSEVTEREITTFADLIDEPNANKIILVEVNVAERLIGWTLTAAQTYTHEIDFLNETIQLNDDSEILVRKEIDSLKENGTALSEQSSIATVEASSGSWWHDTDNGILYVHSTNDDSPDNYVLVGYFWLKLATEGKVLNGYYYEPYVHDKGMPSLHMNNPDIYWGITQVSGGTLKLINSTGFFDQIARRWLWSNKQCKVLLGGEQLPYSEYNLLRTHVITDKKWTRRTFELTLKPKMYDFYRKVPIDSFTVDVYSDMDPDLEGQVIPIVYGLCHSREAVPAYCIERSLGAGNVWKMKCAGHGVHSYNQAYIKYSDEEGWKTLSIASEFLASAEFAFVSGSYTPGYHEVKMALSGVESGNGYIEKPPHIIEHFLTTYCDVDTSDISSSHLSASLNLTESILALPILEEMEAIQVIDEICKSDLAFFDESEEGKFRYRTWTPLAASSFASIDEKHVIKYDIKDSTEELFYNVKVGYRYDPIEDDHLYVTKTYTPGQYLYDQSQTLTHDTSINDKSSAERLAERLLLHLRQPPVFMDAQVKMALVDRLLGDQMKLTLSRSPYETAGGWSDRIFELSRIDLSFFPLKTKTRAFDLGILGGNAGFWVASDVSSYGAYDSTELFDKGFWSDSEGYVVPGSEATLNISNWW